MQISYYTKTIIGSWILSTIRLHVYYLIIYYYSLFYYTIHEIDIFLWKLIKCIGSINNIGTCKIVLFVNEHKLQKYVLQL